MDKSKDILIIPRYQVALRFIEIPSTDPSEIKSMMEFQTFKESPYQKKEIITSFRNIGSYKKGFSCIMLAIAKRQHIEEIMAQNGAKPENIRLETELLYLYLLKKSIVKQDKVSLVINIRRDYLEIMIIDNIKPVFSRGLSSLEGWLEEIKRSLSSYKRDKNNKEIEKLVVMHSSNLSMEDIRFNIKTFFSIPANFYEYEENLNSLDMPLEVDLLPIEYIDKRLNKENIRQVFLTYFLLLIVMAMLASFFIFKIREKNKTILAISEKTDKIQKDADRLNLFLKKTGLLKSQKEEGERIVNILKECYELVPQDISLAGLDYGEKDILYCKGIARYMPSVFNFIKVLEKSKYFKKIEVKYATKKEIENQEFTDFSIACFTH
nr:PilN domain-containing protein [Candidatus Omnitrophota bacterium]